jgi:hypothetical protein
VLSGLEAWALRTLVSSLPPQLREIVEAQFQRYVLVQREIDGRALNFYPRRREVRKGLSAPLLAMDSEAAPLARARISIADPSATLHAVLHAVHGRAFSLSFSEDARRFATASGFALEHLDQSWRSSFRLAN